AHRERVAVRGVDLRRRVVEGKGADDAGERGVEVDEVMPPVRGQVPQRPRRGDLLTRVAAIPGEGTQLDRGRDLRAYVVRGLRAPAVGDRERVALGAQIVGQQPDDLEDPPAEGLDDVEDAQGPRVGDGARQ